MRDSICYTARMKRQRRWHKGDSRKTKKTSQGFAVRTRKQNSDSTLLYGAVRTDAVITAKTKKLGSQVFAMQYKEEGHRQYFLYGCVRTDDVMRAKTKKLGSQGFWLSYKDGSKGQYSLYDPSEPMQ